MLRSKYLLLATLFSFSAILCSWDIPAPKGTKLAGDHSIIVQPGKTISATLKCKTRFMTKVWVESVEKPTAPAEKSIKTSSYTNTYVVKCKNPYDFPVKYCFKTYIKEKDSGNTTFKTE